MPKTIVEIVPPTVLLIYKHGGYCVNVRIEGKTVWSRDNLKQVNATQLFQLVVSVFEAFGKDYVVGKLKVK